MNYLSSEEKISREILCDDFPWKKRKEKIQEQGKEGKTLKIQNDKEKLNGRKIPRDEDCIIYHKIISLARRYYYNKCYVKF